jgi:L-asparagine transporter-like permease
VWLWSLGFAVVLLYSNSRSVRNFGSIEYWFALIKVVAIAPTVRLNGQCYVFATARAPHP